MTDVHRMFVVEVQADDSYHCQLKHKPEEEHHTVCILETILNSVYQTLGKSLSQAKQSFPTPGEWRVFNFTAGTAETGWETEHVFLLEMWTRGRISG